MKNSSVIALLILTFMSSVLCRAAGLDLQPASGGNSFLPVEEAYKVSINVQESNMDLVWTIAPGYYLYQEKFKLNAYVGAEEQPLKAELEPGKQHFDEYLGKEVEIFYDKTTIRAAITELPQQFTLKVKSQGCADAGLCYAPRSQYFEIDQRFGTAIETDASAIRGETRADSNNIVASSSAKPRFFAYWVYIVLALGGGLILNLMPCVFPVLSLKALTFAASSGSPHTHHLHGWAYTAGVIGSFLVAATLILIAKTAGEQTGWGFQLQYPPFVAAITYLFLIMGLSLSGMVHFGTSLMGVGQGLTTQEGYRGSFFTGVLAALVASPCTGPMMAPALGFALTQPPLWSLSIFVALGFGMALPFLLLSYSPKLAKMLPRPGVWMEKLKEILAFPMYLTAAWLLFVFGKQVGMAGVFFMLVGAVALIFAIWLFQNLPEGRKFRWFVQGLAYSSIFFAAHTVYVSEDFRAAPNSEWQEFSKPLVQKLRDGGQTVFVDFTADWCITCKVNENVALSRQGFKDVVAQHNVALVKGDWTNEDPRISEILAEFDRSGVPLYLVYPADTRRAPIVLPQLLTQTIVANAIEEAVTGTSVAISK